jgi:hypothetical protein
MGTLSKATFKQTKPLFKPLMHQPKVLFRPQAPIGRLAQLLHGLMSIRLKPMPGKNRAQSGIFRIHILLAVVELD